MEEIYIDIYRDSCDSITTIQGNNTNKLYKIIITENKKRIDLTNKSVKMAYINSQQIGDIIEGLEITNAVEGEITLPITNVLTKQDGIYGCQLAIYNSNGFLEHTGAFSLIVKENLFNKISGELISNDTFKKLTSILEHSEEMAKNLADAKEVNKTLESNISTGKVLNTSLGSNITAGNNINGSLVANSLTAGEKNTELNKSLEETKKYIDGLDGSQNIPQIRLDVTELQNGLKNNQALEYEGSNLTCENTYDGRTEGMTIEGMIYQNLLGGYNTKWTFDKWNNTIRKCTLLKPSAVYTLVLDISNNTGNNNFTIACDNSNNSTQFISPNRGIEKGFNGRKIFKVTSKSDISSPITAFYTIHDPSICTGSCDVKAMLLEGEPSYIPPYFEGIKSVGESEGDKISILSIGENFINKKSFEKPFKALNCNYEVLSNGDIKVTANPSAIGTSSWGAIGIKPEFLVSDISKTYSFYLEFEQKNNQESSIRHFEVVYPNVIGYTNVTFKDFSDGNKIVVSNNLHLNGVPDTDNTLYQLNFGTSLNKDGAYLIIKKICLKEGSSDNFVPYQLDKKEILLNEPLRGFLNGVKDTIEQRDDGIYLIKRVGNTLLDHDINWWNGETDGTYFKAAAKNYPIDINHKRTTENFLCDNFRVEFDSAGNLNQTEYIARNETPDFSIVVQILSSKITPNNTDGLKTWLQSNPTTIYYDLETPVETKLIDVSDLDLDTYNTVTNIMSNNSIPATLKFKIASNLGSLIQNNAKSINDLYKLIDEIVMPGLQKTMAASLLNNIK